MREAAEAGADSLLIADVPSLEAEPFVREADQAGLDLVLIAAANTPQPALERIASLSKGLHLLRQPSRASPALTRVDSSIAAWSIGCGEPVLRRLSSASESRAPEHVRAALDSGAAGVICGSAIVDLAARAGDVVNFVGLLKSSCFNDKVREQLAGAMIESP